MTEEWLLFSEANVQYPVQRAASVKGQDIANT